MFLISDCICLLTVSAQLQQAVSLSLSLSTKHLPLYGLALNKNPLLQAAWMSLKLKVSNALIQVLQLQLLALQPRLQLVTTKSGRQEKSITASSMDVTETDNEGSTSHLGLPSSDDSDDDQRAPARIEHTQPSQAASFVTPAGMRIAETSYSAFHASDSSNKTGTEDCICRRR